MTIKQLETRLQVLEKTEFGKSAGSAKGKPKIEAYEKDRKKGAGALITPAKVNSVMVVFPEKYLSFLYNGMAGKNAVAHSSLPTLSMIRAIVLGKY